ncbi:MAG: site-specific integrase [Clostridium sp.]|nr:site-specific integrase [Clostridium sp.]
MGKKGLNIYHRRDGRWEGRCKDGFHENGKAKYHSVYAATYSAVREKLLILYSSMEQPMSVCSMTVKQIFMEWLDVKRLTVKESTIENYLFKANKYLLTAFGNIKFNELSVNLVYKFIQDKLNDGLSAKYVSDMIVILKSMAKYASKNYNCKNPICNVELPKAEKTELKLYSKEQQNCLKSALLYNMNPTKLGILLCLYTGIRVGELCALKWSDINFHEQTISISKTCQRIRTNGDTATKLIITSPKSRSSVRIIPLPAFIMKLLKGFVPSDENTYLLSCSDKVTEPRTIQYRFQSILRKAELPSINFHALRHIFATSCIEIGFDVKTLSEILGHGTVEITLNRYVHSSMTRKRECMERLCLNTA